MLTDTQSELIEKENEIGRLTKEIVELRLLKAGENNFEEDSNRLSKTDDDDDIDYMEPVLSKSSPRFMDVLHEEHDGVNINDPESGEQTNNTTNQPLDNKG